MLNTPTDVAGATSPEAVFRINLVRSLYEGEVIGTYINNATVAFYRDNTRVSTVASVDGFVVFRTSTPGNYAFRVISAPGYVIPEELVPLGHFTGTDELFVVREVVLVSVYGEITATFWFTTTEYENRRQGISPRACLKTPFRRIFGAFSAIRRQCQTCEPQGFAAFATS